MRQPNYPSSQGDSLDEPSYDTDDIAEQELCEYDAETCITRMPAGIRSNWRRCAGNNTNESTSIRETATEPSRDADGE